MFLLTAAASSGRSVDTGPITTMHLILIGVLIVLVVLAIIWGARNKRARVAAEQEEAKRAAALLAHPQAEATVEAPPAAEPIAVATPKPAPKPRTAAKSAAADAGKGKPAPKIAAAKVAKSPAKAAAKPAAAVVAAPKPKAAAKPAAAKPATAKTPAAKAPAPKPAPPTAATPKPTEAAAATGPAYKLIDVKGLGPKAVPLLEGMGVRTLSDLAGLSAARAAEIDAGLGALAGRLTRDRWVEQAKLLAAGDVATFEATYGKL